MGILQLLAKENYIAYSKPLAKLIGIDEAILFGELCSMYNLFNENEFCCEQERLCLDTCLTEYRLRNALKNLCKIGLVDVVKKGIPAKNWYTLNEEIFIKLLCIQRTSGVKFDTTRDVKFDTTFNKNINNKNKENILKESLIEEFENLWKIYPKKVDKKKSLEYYTSARNKGVSYETIKNGLDKYIEYCKNNEWYSPKHCNRWFRDESWNNEYETNIASINQGTQLKKVGNGAFQL